MERLFSLCTRLHDLLQNEGLLDHIEDDDRESIETVKELNLDVSTEEFLGDARGFAYADLLAMLGNGETIAWLSPHAAVAHGDETMLEYWDNLEDLWSLRFSADYLQVVAVARSPQHLMEICDVVLRLLAVSAVHRVTISKRNSPDLVLINAPSLEGLMEQCQSLKFLLLKNLEMDENHCRVLGAYSRPDLEILLIHCELTSAGACALADVLGRNQGPTKLDSCQIGNLVLANGLCGNSRLKSLTTRTSDNIEVGNREVLAIAGALRENKGLVDMNLRCWGFRVSDEAWRAFCDSLKAHPTLEILDIRRTFMEDTTVKSRMQALSDMVKVNTSMHTIYLFERNNENEDEFFRGSIIPYLETNRFRPRLLAVQKTRPIVYRAKVLGRALLAARSDANSFWMLLSGNAEVAFPPTTTTTSLPTPATAAATSNVAAVAATVTATLADSATSASAAAYAATPTARQKRKARP
jgi:hypothetical protein